MSILVILNTFYLKKTFLWNLRGIAIAATLFDIIQIPDRPFISDLLSIIAHLLYASFLGITILVILRDLFLEKYVNQDTVRGGICLYLLLGFFWFMLYKLIYLIDSNAFTHLGQAIINPESKLLYFSFTTLTTLGYGDVLPSSPVAMMVTNLEALVGQLYPAIFLARLVTLYSSPSPLLPPPDQEE